MVGRPSVCLSHRSTAATVAGGFAAERRRLQQISVNNCGRRAAGVMLRADGGDSTQTYFILFDYDAEQRKHKFIKHSQMFGFH